MGRSTLEVTVEVPKIEGVAGEAATLVKWIKKEGEYVKKGEPLLLIEFPKAEFEIPSPASGRLVKILAKEGKMVRVNNEVGVLQT